MRRGSEAPDSLPLVTARRRLPGSGARCGLVAASLVSSFASLLPTATFLYLLIDHDCWGVIMARCHRWLERNHWDVKVRGNIINQNYCIFDPIPLVYRTKPVKN